MTFKNIHPDHKSFSIIILHFLSNEQKDLAQDALHPVNDRDSDGTYIPILDEYHSRNHSTW